MLICSAKFEDYETEYVEQLQNIGHQVLYTAGHGEPKLDGETWLDYGARMMRKSLATIPTVDAVLCLNFDKDDRKNYIGGATFCEMAYAFEHNKKIFVLNDLPNDGIGGASIRFELEMFRPTVLGGDLLKLGGV